MNDSNRGFIYFLKLNYLKVVDKFDVLTVDTVEIELKNGELLGEFGVEEGPPLLLLLLL